MKKINYQEILKKTKPCMNDMCGIFVNELKNYNCHNVLGCLPITLNNLRKCRKYLTEKPKSSIEEIVKRVEFWVIGIMEWSGKYTKKDHDEIMQEIEKELKNE